MCWSPNGRRLATASYDKTVIIWDVEIGQPETTLEGFSGFVMDVAWSPSGDLLACADYHGAVHVYSASTRNRLHVFDQDIQQTWGITWAPDGQIIAAACGNTVRTWNVTTGGSGLTLVGHTKVVYLIAWSPNGQLLASTSQEGDATVRVWEAHTGKAVHVFKGHSKEPFCVAWSPGSSRIVSGSMDTTLRIWDVQTGLAERVLHGFSAEPVSVSWSRDESKLSVSVDPVCVIDSDTGRVIRDFEGRNGTLASTGEHIAVISAKNDVHIRSVSSGTVEVAIKHNGKDVRIVAWSPDNHVLMLASNRLVVSNARTGATISTFDSHYNGTMAHAPNKELIAIGIKMTVSVWKGRIKRWESKPLPSDGRLRKFRRQAQPGGI